VDIIGTALVTFFAALGIIGSVLTILQFARPDIHETFLLRVPTLGRIKFRKQWDTDRLTQRMRKATREIAILQTWLPTLNKDIPQWAAIAATTHFRILLMDESLIHLRRACREVFGPPLTDANLQALTDLEAKCGLDIHVSRYQVLPFGPIYIIDQQVYFGLYLSHTDSMMGPQFRCRRNSWIGKAVTESFEKIWQHSEENRRSQLTAQHSAAERHVGGEFAPEAPYKRYCDSCGTYLKYRDVGPEGALLTESYCANANCPKHDQRVESDHVS